MAEVNAKDLTTKTAPASTDSMLLFGTSTNEGAKITVDNLANNILERLTTKTFANQVGGSSAATILAQLATLNSKMVQNISTVYTGDLDDLTTPCFCQASTAATNGPITGKYWRVIVLNFRGTATQICFDNSGSGVYYRHYSNSVWQSWHLFTQTNV